MNIFILDRDLKKNAQYHVDKHISKMIIEAVQVLCSAYYYTGQEELSPYRKTHFNHPVAVWSRYSLQNWLWLRDYAVELYDEFTYRYNNTHKSGELIFDLQLPDLPVRELTEHVQCMPDEYKCDDVVQAYRNYYNGDKRHLFKWKNREVPEWIKED